MDHILRRPGRGIPLRRLQRVFGPHGTLQPEHHQILSLRHGALGQKAGVRLRLLAAQDKQLVGQHRRLRQAAAGKAVGLQLAPEKVQQLLLPLRAGGEHAVGHGPVPPAVLQGQHGIAVHLHPAGVGRRLVPDKFQLPLQIQGPALAEVQGRPELLLGKGPALLVLDLSQAPGVEEHPVPLVQLQLQHLIDHILILSQRSVGGGLDPLVPVLAPHQQGDLLPGVDAGKFPRHAVQHPHQGVEHKGAAHLVELAVGRRHGRRQREAGAQLALDGRLSHDRVEGLGNPLPRHRPDDHAQAVLIQHEVVVEVVLHLPAGAQQPPDGKLIPLLPPGQLLGEHGAVELVGQLQLDLQLLLPDGQFLLLKVVQVDLHQHHPEGVGEGAQLVVALDLHLGKGGLVLAPLIVLGRLGQKPDGLNEAAPDHQHVRRDQHRRQHRQQYAGPQQEIPLGLDRRLHVQLRHHVGAGGAVRPVHRGGRHHPPAQLPVLPGHRVHGPAGAHVVQRPCQGALQRPDIPQRGGPLRVRLAGAEQNQRSVLLGAHHIQAGHASLSGRSHQSVSELPIPLVLRSAPGIALQLLRVQLAGKGSGDALAKLAIEGPGVSEIDMVACGQSGGA